MTPLQLKLTCCLLFTLAALAAAALNQRRSEYRCNHQLRWQ